MERSIVANPERAEKSIKAAKDLARGGYFDCSLPILLPMAHCLPMAHYCPMAHCPMLTYGSTRTFSSFAREWVC